MKEKMPKGGSIYITCQKEEKNKKCAKNIAVPVSCESNGQTHFPFLGKKMGGKINNK